MIQRSAILLEHVSCFSYCLLIIKLYWGVKWITIKKKCLLVQVQIHRYSWKLPFPWPQGNIAVFHKLPSVSAQTLSPHPALPRAPAEHLFRATCHFSVYTDEWREYCLGFCLEVSTNLSCRGCQEHKDLGIQPFPALGNQESTPCCEKQLA